MKHLLLIALAACGPKVDPAAPGIQPEPTEGLPPAHGATHLAPSRPPPPVMSDEDPPPPPPPPGPAPTPSKDAPPDRALAKLDAAKGSKVSANIFVTTDGDETHLTGTVTGLAKNTAYMLSKRDHCAAIKADDSSRRSAPVIYGVSIKADAKGEATIDDTSKAIHLDGPLSVMGAMLVVSKTVSSPELACGRIGIAEPD